MMEDKIINDVLVYLDGWELQDKDHKHRHKPHPPKFLDPFQETDEEIENTNIRKTVTKREILDMYEVAKIHALNYIKRPVFPRTPVTHIAICMWTAGLLSQKARFRKQKTENSYNLINEAKKLLKPHVKHNPTIMVVGGSDRYEVEDYTIQKHHPICPKPKKKKHIPSCMEQHPHHPKPKKHHHHHHHKHHHEEEYPYFEFDEPEYDDFFLKRNHILLKLLEIDGGVDDTVTLKAYVRDVYGNRIDYGKVHFFLEIDDEDLEQT